MESNNVASLPFCLSTPSDKTKALIVGVVTLLVISITAVALAAIFSPVVGAAIGASFIAAATYIGPIGVFLTIVGIVGTVLLGKKRFFQIIERPFLRVQKSIPKKASKNKLRYIAKIEKHLSTISSVVFNLGRKNAFLGATTK